VETSWEFVWHNAVLSKVIPNGGMDGDLGTLLLCWCFVLKLLSTIIVVDHRSYPVG